MLFFTYLLRQTWKNLRQTWGTQLLTLLTVSLSVLIFTFFFLIYTNLIRAGENLGDDLRVIVYLDQEIPEQLRPEIEKNIRAFGMVEKIAFVSRADAFARFSSQLNQDKDVLEDLSKDFLPPSIEVYPQKNLDDIAGLDRLSGFLQTLPHVAKVQSGSDWLQRLAYFVKLLRAVVLLSGIMLTISLTFTISYTLRLTILSRRQEFEILRLLGASSAYLRLPLLFEGLLQGLLGSSLGLTALYLIYRNVASQFSGPALLANFDFRFFPPDMLAAIMLSGMLLCASGCLFSIRRFVRI